MAELGRSDRNQTPCAPLSCVVLMKLCPVPTKLGLASGRRIRQVGF